jgi:dienelactone hydrolase
MVGMKLMKRLQVILLLFFMFLLVACAGAEEVPLPEATGNSSPEAVAASLATVKAEDQLHLFEYDREAPLDIQEEGWTQENGVTRIDFTFASPKGGRVPARLMIPRGEGPFPGLMIQHGSLGNYEGLMMVARDFVSYGAVVVMINDPYSRPGGWEPSGGAGDTWPYFTDQDMEIKIQSIVDMQRAIDLLAARPEVDPERMAYYGISYGAAMGGLFAGVEDRLKAYVLQVGDGGLVEHTSEPGEDGRPLHFSQKWADRMWPTESLHFVGRAAPAALLFNNGIHDELVPPRDAIRYQIAGSEPKTIVWYDSGHALPNEATIDSAIWLQTYLGEELRWFTPNYRASALVLDRFFTVWIVLGFASIGFYVWYIYRSKAMAWGERVLWFLALIFMGPVGLALYWFTARRQTGTQTADPLMSLPRQALQLTVLSSTALTIGFLLGNGISEVDPALDFRLKLLILYIAYIFTSWLISWLARRTYRSSGFAHVITANLIWIVTSLVGGFLSQVWNTNSLLSPFTLMIITSNTVVSVLVTFPLHVWMLGRGMETWMAIPADDLYVGAKKPISRNLQIGIGILSFILVALGVLLLLVFSTGLTFQEVMRLVLG